MPTILAGVADQLELSRSIKSYAANTATKRVHTLAGL
jgi:hypothetical protein